MYVHLMYVQYTYTLLSLYSVHFSNGVVYIYFLFLCQRAQSDLSAHQKKIFPIDDHIAVSIAGLTADGRALRCVCVCVCVPACVYADCGHPLSNKVLFISLFSNFTVNS